MSARTVGDQQRGVLDVLADLRIALEGMAGPQAGIQAHVDSLRTVVAADELVEVCKDRQIIAARESGVSFGIIGAALGVTKEGARKRYAQARARSRSTEPDDRP